MDEEIIATVFRDGVIYPDEMVRVITLGAGYAKAQVLETEPARALVLDSFRVCCYPSMDRRFWEEAPFPRFRRKEPQASFRLTIG